MKTTFGPQRMLFPLPTVLVVTGNMTKANIITIAWITMHTGKSPTLGIAVGTRGYSGEQIRANMNFTVNIATVDIMKEADFCGITSGREVDKFKATGFTKLPSTYIESPIIKECPVNLECRLVESNMVGPTNHFVGEILETHIDTDHLGDQHDPGTLDIRAVNPLIYYSGVREYWSLGEKVGDAYEIGKGLTISGHHSR
ncbi:MAG: flavin reductase family protein [Bacteroidales bacterium]|nr:flavin reductase family protein [Bacteroidota bacterium]MBL6950634.1 flavin reductase family protein [Bacteroidales bacterium]